MYVIELNEKEFLDKNLIFMQQLWGTDNINKALQFENKESAKKELNIIKKYNLDEFYPKIKIKKIKENK